MVSAAATAVRNGLMGNTVPPAHRHSYSRRLLGCVQYLFVHFFVSVSSQMAEAEHQVCFILPPLERYGKTAQNCWLASGLAAAMWENMSFQASITDVS